MPKAEVFTSGDVCDYLGIPRRLLNYMVEAGLVTPSVRQGQGPGSRRLFSFSDLIQIDVSRLFSRGADTEVVRHALQLIREHPNLEQLDDKDSIVWDRRGEPRWARYETREDEIAARERGEALLLIGVGMVKRFLRENIDNDRRWFHNPAMPEWAASVPSSAGKRDKR